MKLLMIGGNIPKSQIDEIMNNTIGNFQFAANEFQNKLIKGFKNEIKKDFYLLSAPFINSFPKGYKKIFYKSIKSKNNEKYVSFFNMWGIRNISRKHQLIKESKFFLNIDDNDKYVIVYSPHVPFLQTALYLKNKDKRIKIILLLPDLPQFLALQKNKSILYRIFKPYDIKKFYKCSNKFDSYILLTEQMNDFVNKDRKKPFMVVEGIADNKYLNLIKKVEDMNNTFTISYTGTLHKKFGICNLVDAFMQIKDKNYKLNICGIGDSVDYIKLAMKKDNRIIYHGKVTNEIARMIQKESTVLVNPRQNIEDFTKYSFPSKNMEYLSSGKPVIAYKLDGIPKEYDDILFYPDNNSISSFKEKIVEISNIDKNNLKKYRKRLFKFLKSKQPEIVCKRIINFIER